MGRHPDRGLCILHVIVRRCLSFSLSLPHTKHTHTHKHPTHHPNTPTQQQQQQQPPQPPRPNNTPHRSPSCATTPSHLLHLPPSPPRRSRAALKLGRQSRCFTALSTRRRARLPAPSRSQSAGHDGHHPAPIAPQPARPKPLLRIPAAHHLHEHLETARPSPAGRRRARRAAAGRGGRGRSRREQRARTARAAGADHGGARLGGACAAGGEAGSSAMLASAVIVSCTSSCCGTPWRSTPGEWCSASITAEKK